MRVIVNGRQAGKTYTLVEWVKKGEETDSYPFWSRVILTHSIHDADRLRKDYNLDYHQVFSVNEWQTAHLGPMPVELGVDNADILLHQFLGRLPSVITMTGSTD